MKPIVIIAISVVCSVVAVLAVLASGDMFKSEDQRYFED